MTAGDRIVITCAADDAYAMPLAVALRSALDALSRERRCEAFVLDGGLCAESRAKIERSLASPRMALHFVRPDREIFAGIRHRGRVSLTSYFRILLAELLPKSVARAIYLDADVRVRADLSRLWAEAQGDHPVLAVRDAGAPTVGAPLGLRNHRELGLAPQLAYFNAGVMVADLERWREEQLGARLLGYLEEHADAIRWWDQDALNALLAGRWGELDPRWNQIPQVFDRATADTAAFPRAMREVAMRDPWIVHYSTWSKPWHWSCAHPARELFFETLDRTAWAGWRPRKQLSDTWPARPLLRVARGLRRRFHASR
jgi:lipopolysaccharide biosynthesis glycosyltransferase